MQPKHVADLLGHVNRAVPRLGVDITRYSYHVAVQERLRHIFSIYLDDLLSIVRIFNAPRKYLALGRLKAAETYILNALAPGFDMRTVLIILEQKRPTKHFRQARAAFDEALQQAEQENAQRNFCGHRTYANGVLSTFGTPFDTQATFKTLRILGRGSLGQIDEVEEITTGCICARKNIQLGGNDSVIARRQLEQIEKEFRIMEKLTHAHIITVTFWLRSETVCSIFMTPSCDMDLRVYLNRCIYEYYAEDALAGDATMDGLPTARPVVCAPTKYHP